MIRRPPRSTLFPYTRSSDLLGLQARNDAGVVAVHAVDLDAGGLGEAVVQLLVRGVVARGVEVDDLGVGNGCAGSHQGASGKQRSEEHTSELQSQSNIVCRLLL